MKTKLIATMSFIAALTSASVAVAAGLPEVALVKYNASTTAGGDRVGQEVVACDNIIYNCCWQRSTRNTAGWYPFTGSADGLVLCPDGVDSYTDCQVGATYNDVSTKNSAFYIKNSKGSWKKGPTPSSCGIVYEPKSGVKSSSNS